MDLSKKDKNSEIASFILMALAVFITFHYHLLGGFIAGCLVYSITQLISNKMEEKFNLGKISRAIFILFIAVFISVACSAFVIMLINFTRGGFNGEGLGLVFEKIIVIIEGLKDSLPASIQNYIPESAETLKVQLISHIQQNKDSLSNIGIGFFHNFVRFILGLVIGCMLAFATFKKPENYNPLSREILTRLINLKDSFDKVVFAQIKISFFNTLFTSVYLLVILPIMGINLPLVKTMIFITFIAGLIPVLGNIISNTVMVVISLGVSLKVAIWSLVFLIVIHKLEYFLNAKIIGNKIQATYWELVIAIVVMEIIFGIGGAISAPFLYAYIKKELSDKKYI